MVSAPQGNRKHVLVDDFLIQGSYRYLFDKHKRYGLYEKCFSSFIESLAIYDDMFVFPPVDAGSISEETFRRHIQILELFKGTVNPNQFDVDKELLGKIFDRYVIAPDQKLSILIGNRNKDTLARYMSGQYRQVQINIPALEDTDEKPYAKYLLEFHTIYPQWEKEILDICNAELQLGRPPWFNDKPDLMREWYTSVVSFLQTNIMFRIWVICNSHNLNYVANPLSSIFIQNTSLTDDAAFAPLRKIITDCIRDTFTQKINNTMLNELKTLTKPVQIYTKVPNLLKYVIQEASDADAMRNRILELRNSKEARSYRQWCAKLEKPRLGKGRIDLIKEIMYAVEDLNDRFDIKDKPRDITWRISVRIDPYNPLPMLEGTFTGKLQIAGFRKIWRKFKERVQGDKHIDFLNMAI